MVANNKEDFLFQLHNELHRIGIDADEDIFSDFEEHFKASSMEGISEEETCRRLGDVKEIARSYINIESSRLNSIVAQAIESDRPHVSLTKPGRDVPADLSLVKSKPAEEAEQPEAIEPRRAAMLEAFALNPPEEWLTAQGLEPRPSYDPVPRVLQGSRPPYGRGRGHGRGHDGRRIPAVAG